MKSLIKYTIILFALLFNLGVNAQGNLTIKCNKFLTDGFVSDGQEYKAKVDENNKAEFYTTFYGGSKYRIIACTEIKEFPLVLTVFDTEKNILFCNKHYNYTSYWNFTFTSTIDCIIELEFETEGQIKDEVMLLIGFKEN